MNDGLMEQKNNVRGPGRTTRDDWLKAAMHTLINEGVSQVKILTLASDLECARSSFYWYFKNRSELLDSLLDFWSKTNTQAIIDAADVSADNIILALAQLYADWLPGNTFNTSLDFAIRDWAKRSESVRLAVLEGDKVRMQAIAKMFTRHGYPIEEAEIRARIVYLTQIGYSTLDQRETWEQRASRGALYLQCMTGIKPTKAQIDFLLNATEDKLRA